MNSPEKPDPESVLASIGALDAPAVTAAKMLGGLIAACRGEDVHRTRAEVDLRAIQDIQRKLQADPEDLEVIWVNLLENAVQYSVAGSKVVIQVGRESSGAACVSVQDSGPGIPEEQLPHVFQRFYRGDPSRSRSTGGFGLGLAICKAIVTAYGGQIGAISGEGQGTEIRVQLPIRSAEATS